MTGVLNTLVLICGSFFTRFVATFVMGEYLISTTSVSSFIAAMQRMHCPAAFTIPISEMFRFFPTVFEEWRSIRSAMGMRGIRIGGEYTAKIFEYQVVPTMTCCARIGEELSVASLARGLDVSTKRTSISPIGFRVQDFLLLALCAVIVLAWVGALMCS